MRSIDDISVNEKSSLFDVLKIIDKSSKQLALVIDDNNKLLGTLSDGDVRRALLKGVSLEDSIESIYFKNPTVAYVNDSKDDIIRICTTKKIHQIPILDDKGNVIGLEILDELVSQDKLDNRVILMVGGLGTRLRPLTDKVPKPMLKVGDKPILQTIVEKFASCGFNQIVMCVNYKSDIIREYFKDGSEFGVDIEYVYEEKRMGTAGALSLLSSKPNEPFFVMNGDLLTNINFEHLLEFHKKNKSVATMCVMEYDLEVPYGVVNIKENEILSIQEKPVHKYFVNAGIYMLNPSCLELIPKDQFFDMPSLFDKLLQKKEKSCAYLIRDYWLDIGRIEEFKKANDDYHEVF